VEPQAFQIIRLLSDMKNLQHYDRQLGLFAAICLGGGLSPNSTYFDLLYNTLYNRSATNRTNVDWASTHCIGAHRRLRFDFAVETLNTLCL